MPSHRLSLDRSRGRIRIVGTRPALVLTPGDGGAIRWRSERPVSDWKRHFGNVRRDLARVDEILTEHGLRLAVPGEWDRAVRMAEEGR